MPRLLDHVNFPKLVTVFSIIFGIALGACGLTALVSSSQLGEYLVPLAIIEVAVMIISAAVLVLTFMVWIVVAAIGDRGSKTIKLFDGSDENKPES